MCIRDSSKGEITDDYLQEEMELTEILLKPPEAEAIRTLPVSYTHLDVYKRQVSGSRTGCF